MIGKPIEEVDNPRIRKSSRPLAETHPEVADTWYYRKNCGFGPEDFSHGSMVIAWWICKKYPSHNYDSQIKVRVRGARHTTDGCPYCAGQRVCDTNWLAKHKDICRELHPTKNGKVFPRKIHELSSKRYWWQCRTCKHNWRTTVSARVRDGQGCPRCNLGYPTDLRKFPEALAMFDEKRNKNADVTRLDRQVKYWWQCPEAPDHRFQAGFYRHNRDTPQCPFCAGRRSSSTNSLKQYPWLVKEFHPTRNGNLKPKDVPEGSHTYIWWKCPEGPDHEWATWPYDRIKLGRGCPFCLGRKMSVTNTLDNIPEVARDWHPRKNSKLTPAKVRRTDQRKAHWLCHKCGMEWAMRIYSRTVEGLGCPECRRRKTNSGRLSDRQRKELFEMLKAGHSAKEVAEKFSIHIGSAYRFQQQLRDSRKKKPS